MQAKAAVLIVDDEPYVRDSLALLLTRGGYAAQTAGGCEEALEILEGSVFDAVITDLKMPGVEGGHLVRAVSRRVPVVVLTGHGTVSSAVELMRLGAADYLLKPASPEQLAEVLRRVVAHPSAPAPSRGDPIGVSAAWRRARELVELAAPTTTSVLLLGESGTGKEELARLLHRRSPRAAAAFVGVNCAAIPGELFESEFFGHRRGAFTGAVNDREGRFKAADGGTLFLDEVSSLPETAQAKLLRVLEEGVFERVGESQPTSVDVRLVAAAGADLPAEVTAGRFRSDLFYRLNVMTVVVPPLRERPDDIAVLAAAFLAELNARLGKRVRSLHPEALRLLETHTWPGNVRELKNVLERGLLLERTEELLPGSLPFDAQAESRPAAAAPAPPLRDALAAEERRLLQDALRRAGGVRREAARQLGVDERNLAYYLRKHGLLARER